MHGDGESFDGSLCDVPHDNDNGIGQALSNPHQEISDLCNGDLACLVDGTCGDASDAQRALDITTTLSKIFSIDNKQFNRMYTSTCKMMLNCDIQIIIF